MSENSVSQSLPCLFAPVSTATFNADYREQQPLHITRSNPDYFAGVVSVDVLSNLFSTARLFFPDVQLTQFGENIPSTDYANTSGQIDAARLFTRYREGATVVISGADRLITPVAGLCNQLQHRLGINSRANLYVSPPGCQGFGPHYDSHDVLIVQVSGEKVFRFYENNTELPFPEDGFEPNGFESGECTQQITVSAGDTLYVPRGMTHDALAGDSALPSLHLTFGLYPVLMRDVLHGIIDELAVTEPGLRRSICTSDWYAQGVSSRLQDTVGNLISAESMLQTLPDVMRAVRDDAALASRSSAHLVREPFRATTNVPTDQVVLQTERYLGSERLGGVLYCRTFGQVLEFRAPFDALVEKWLQAGTVARSHFSEGSATSDDAASVLDSLCNSGLCVIKEQVAHGSL